jgi:hypothetical protein
MDIWDRISPSEIQFRGREMRYSYLGSEIILVDHLINDLIAGDLLIRLHEEADEGIVYKRKFFVVIEVRIESFYTFVSIASADAMGRVECVEKLDGLSGDCLGDFGYRRVCNAKYR